MKEERSLKEKLDEHQKEFEVRSIVSIICFVLFITLGNQALDYIGSHFVKKTKKTEVVNLLLTEGRSGHFNIGLSTWSRKGEIVYEGKIWLENINHIDFSFKDQIGDANPIIASYLQNGEIKKVSCDGYYY